MEDSSIVLGQPVRSSRLQTFPTSQLASDRGTNEILRTVASKGLAAWYGVNR